MTTVDINIRGFCTYLYVNSIQGISTYAVHKLSGLKVANFQMLARNSMCYTVSKLRFVNATLRRQLYLLTILATVVCCIRICIVHLTAQIVNLKVIDQFPNAAMQCAQSCIL